ncbi:MAG: hypothetical protein HYU60_02090 [Magnetospirillum sp.]|nr:hypothetical protein [Magnetospirillum sp.]
MIGRRLPSLALLLALPLSAAAAPAAERQPPPIPAAIDAREVVLSVWQFTAPGMSDKKGCRTRVVITNRSNGVVNFSGRIYVLNGARQEVDGWHVSAAHIRPNEETERLYSCAPGAQMLRLQGSRVSDDSPACSDDGKCPLTLKVETNLKRDSP